MSRSGMFESVVYNGDGVIAWRRGTGDNVELTYIRADQQRQGSGRRLLACMLRELREYPPYHSIFGFTRVSNADAQAFYAAMGFALTEVKGVYRDGQAVLFSASYAELSRIHLEG